MTRQTDGLTFQEDGRGLSRRHSYSDGTGRYLPKKAATTPYGLPIPGSAYSKAIAKTILKRFVPLPLQIVWELYELWNTPAISVPAGWSQTLGNCGPGGIIGWVEVTSCPTPSQCNDILSAVNNSVPNLRGKVFIRQTFFAPPLGQVHSVWNKTNCVSDGTRPELVGPTLLRMPVKIPPEWLQPDLAPEIVPPTAPQVSPQPKPFRYIPGPNTAPFPWEIPDYGTDRGPKTLPQPSPLPDYEGPGPAPGYSPAPTYDPGADPAPEWNPAPWPQPSAVPWPTLPGLDPRTNPAPGRSPFPGRLPEAPTRPMPFPIVLPPPSRVPVVQTSPRVSIRIEPPGWSRLKSFPPGPGVKERKFIAAVPPGAASRIIGGVTEGLDLVKCLHDALPKGLKAKRKKRVKEGGDFYEDQVANRYNRPSFFDRAKAVYAAMDKIIPDTGESAFSANDIMNAIVGCGVEQFKDRIYAELGRAGGRAGRRLNLSHGFGLGGSVRQQVTGGLTPLR